MCSNKQPGLSQVMFTQRKRRRTSVRNTDGSLTCPVCLSRAACVCCSSCRRAAGRSCCPPPILKGKERGEFYQELQLLGSAGYPVPLGVRRMRRQQRQDHAHRRPLQCGRAQKPLSPPRQLPMLPTTPSPCDTHTSTSGISHAPQCHPQVRPHPPGSPGTLQPMPRPQWSLQCPIRSLVPRSTGHTLTPLQAHPNTSAYPWPVPPEPLPTSHPNSLKRGPGSVLTHAQTLCSSLTSCRDQNVSPQLLFSS